MPRRLFFLLLTGTWMTFLPGCKKEPPPQPAPVSTNHSPAQVSTNVVPPAATNAPSAATLLQVRWQPGRRYVYRMEVTQRSTSHLGDAPPTQENLSNGLTYALSVRDSTTNGGHELDLQFLACDMEIKMGDQIVVAFDSAESTTQLTNNPVPAPFRKLVGSTLRVQIDARGACEKVVDLEQWTQQMAGDASGPAGQMFVQQFNEGFFRQLIGFAKGLPDKPVDAGESWPFRTEIPAGILGQIILESVITFQRWDDHDHSRFAVLATQGKIRSRPDPDAPATGSMFIEHGTVVGTAWFDPAIGALVESAVEQTMTLKGKSTPTADGERPDSEFTSQIEQKVTMKLVELEKVAP